MKHLFFISLILLVNIPAKAQWTIKSPKIIDSFYAIEGAVAIDSIVYMVSFGTSNKLQIESYNPSIDSWTLYDSIVYHTGDNGVATANGKIYIIGGYNVDCECAVDSVLEYAPATHAWEVKTPMITSRSQLSVTTIDGVIYAVGGWPADFSENEAFDPVANAWTSKAPMPVGGQQMNSAVTIDGKMHLIGGKNSGNSVWYTWHDVYDPSTDSWDTLAPLPGGRFQGNAVIADNTIYYLGGSNAGNAIAVYPIMFNNNYVYDSATNSWIECDTILQKTAFNGAGVVNGKIYLISDSFTYQFTPPGCSGGLSTPTFSNKSISEKIEIFPNPTTSILTLTYTQPITQIAITNLLGQTVYFTTSCVLLKTGGDVQVDVSGLPAGIYFVKVNGAEVRKFVKE